MGHLVAWHMTREHLRNAVERLKASAYPGRPDHANDRLADLSIEVADLDGRAFALAADEAVSVEELRHTEEEARSLRQELSRMADAEEVARALVDYVALMEDVLRARRSQFEV